MDCLCIPLTAGRKEPARNTKGTEGEERREESQGQGTALRLSGRLLFCGSECRVVDLEPELLAHKVQMQLDQWLTVVAKRREQIDSLR